QQHHQHQQQDHLQDDPTAAPPGGGAAPVACDPLGALEAVFASRHDLVRAVYQHYACADAGRGISPAAFSQFCADSGLLAAVGQRRADACRLAAAAHSSPSAEPPAAGEGSAAPLPRAFRSPSAPSAAAFAGGAPNLDPPAFVEALARLAAAARKARGLQAAPPRGCPGWLPRAVRVVLDDYVAPKALRSSLDGFRRACDEPAVQKCVGRWHRPLMKAFRLYHVSVTTARGSGSLAVPMDQFQKFVKDCKLLDRRFTCADARLVYTCAMCNDEPPGQEGMRFTEWVEGIVSISAFRFPTPFMPHAYKIDLFFKTVLLPRLKDRFVQTAL
ncbi:Fimbrin, partial [Diplonema papillatum]